MQLYQSHLTKSGVFCAYVDQQNVIPKTIANAFLEADQFRFRTIVASQNIVQYDLEYMQNLAVNYSFLTTIPINPQTIENINPKKLLAQYVRSRDQILSDEKNIPNLTDLNPWLEYYFLNSPGKTPVWSKDDSQEDFLNRITGCDFVCKSEILNESDESAE